MTSPSSRSIPAVESGLLGPEAQAGSPMDKAGPAANPSSPSVEVGPGPAAGKDTAGQREPSPSEPAGGDAPSKPPTAGDAPGKPLTPSLAEELAKAKYEPLLPAEKRLMTYSLGIGLLLLVLLVWVSRTFFEPAPASPAETKAAAPR